MPRPPRLHIPGACYHVILRGNHREALFGNAADRHVLNNIVADVIGRFGCRVHAFCWMSNHLHALVQIADRPLGQVMQRIAMRYSRYRHKTLGTTGHLFERRHKAKLVDVDAYLRQARSAYEQFMRQSADDDENFDEASHPEDSRILGTDRFISNIPLVPFKSRSSLTLEQLAESVCAQHSTSLRLLRSPSRARHLARLRLTVAIQAIEQRVATLAAVARFFNRDPSALTKLMARHEHKRPTGSQVT